MYGQQDLFTFFLAPLYDPVKTSTRDSKTYVSDALDSEFESRKNFLRRTENLTTGFFCEKAKPYQPLGSIHLISGDLMLDGLTKDIKSKVS